MPYGYNQAVWDAMPQRTKNMIKAAQGSLPADGSLLAPGPSGTYDFGLGFGQAEAPVEASPVDYGPSSGSPADVPATFVEPVRRTLASSPEWLAYLNALGLEQSTFAADIARQRGLYQSEANRQIADLGPQYDIQRRGITGNAEGRGVLRSGEFQRRLAENRATQGRQVGGIQGGLTGQLGNLQSQLAQKQIDVAARRAQQQLSMLGSGSYV